MCLLFRTSRWRLGVTEVDLPTLVSLVNGTYTIMSVVSVLYKKLDKYITQIHAFNKKK